MEKKYELVKENTKVLADGTVLYRIRALRKVIYHTVGALGGYVESEDNLSQEGSCWVEKDSVVYGNAVVSGNATVRGKSVVAGILGEEYLDPGEVTTLSRPTIVRDSATICDSIIGCGAVVGGKAAVSGVKLGKDAVVFGDSDYLVIGGVDTVYRAGSGKCVWTGRSFMGIEDYVRLNNGSKELSNMVDVYFAGPEGMEFAEGSYFKDRMIRRQAEAFVPQSPTHGEGSTEFAMINDRSEAKKALLKYLIRQLLKYEG